MNLFNIEQELVDIFNELEDNGGELTPELEEKLKILEGDFKEKLSAYVNVVNKYKSDIDACKKEKSRIDLIKKTKENVIERLNKAMLFAVENFGDTGKSGNKVVDLPTCKLYTKQSTSYDYNLGTINQILECFVDWFVSLWNNDMTDPTIADGFTSEVVTNAINRFYEAKYPEDAAKLKEQYGELFTESDLENIIVKVEGSFSLTAIAKAENWDFMNTYLNHQSDALTPTDISATPNKDMIKAMLKNHILNKYTTECKNNSLIIK